MKKSDYISAKYAAKLAGESVCWIYQMTNRGFIDCYGFNGECLFNIVDVEKLIQEKIKGGRIDDRRKQAGVEAV